MKLTKEELMTKLAESIGQNQAQEDEFSVDEYAELLGIPPNLATKYLSEAVRNGKVTRRKAIINSRRRYVYKIEEK